MRHATLKSSSNWTRPHDYHAAPHLHDPAAAVPTAKAR